MRVPLQLRDGQADGAVGAAAGGVDRFEAPERFVEIDLHALLDRERADAADRVARIGRNLVVGQHFGLGVELRLEFRIVHLRVAGGDDQNARVVRQQERKRLGDALSLHAERLRGQLDRRAGHVELLNSVLDPQRFEIRAYLFNGHKPASCNKLGVL